MNFLRSRFNNNQKEYDGPASHHLPPSASTTPPALLGGVEAGGGRSSSHYSSSRNNIAPRHRREERTVGAQSHRPPPPPPPPPSSAASAITSPPFAMATKGGGGLPGGGAAAAARVGGGCGDRRRHPVAVVDRSRSTGRRRGRGSSKCNNNHNGEPPPLTPGISSARTSREVTDHLPARAMGPAVAIAPPSPGGATTTASRGRGYSSSAQHGDGGVDGGFDASARIPENIIVGGGRDDAERERGDRGGGAPTHHHRDPRQEQQQQRRRRQQRGPAVPMEHDGGVLCLCAVPSRRRDRIVHNGGDPRRAHRFLSGGADGTVRLWEAREPGYRRRGSDEREPPDVKIAPRLVKTYAGHAGYVHSIAVLGTCEAIVAARRTSRDDIASALAMLTRSTMKRIDNRGDGSQGQGRGGGGGHSKKRRMLLFVSASRDNTVRIWPIVDDNDDGGAGNDDNVDGSGRMADESERSGYSDRSGPGSSLHSDDPIFKGVKLRGHQFGKDGMIGGVLCVCALPSLRTAEDDLQRSLHSLPSLGDVTDAGSGNDGAAMESAGQFCSGGSDGVVRVWDVRSALNLRRAPKSGVYATVQLQCISPPGGGGGGGHPTPPAITSLVCTHHQGGGGGVRGGGRGTSLFSGDALGTVRRYSCMNEAGNVNGAIWWGYTGLFVGHDHPISSMAMLSSPPLRRLLRPDDEDPPPCGGGEEEHGTMLASSCEDGWVRVWDACDARRGSSETDEDDRGAAASGGGGRRRRTPRREPMWEIDLNIDNEGGAPFPGGRIGVTSLAALQAGTLIAAGTTDGKIRMWNVSSGLYEGAYNLGRSVQVWSLGVASERDECEEVAEYDYAGRDSRERTVRNSVGIIVSGDNAGRIRVTRKISSNP